MSCSICYCKDVGGLMSHLGGKHIFEKLRLFFDSSKTSLKAVLFHNRNKNTQSLGWAECTAEHLLELKRKFTCIDDVDDDDALQADEVSCGNGFVEGHEECDCGNLPKHMCSTNCCDQRTCRLKSRSQCSDGACCHLATCTFKTNETICRPAKDDECDVDEKCDGNMATCPPNVHQDNGLMCSGEHYCYDGGCVTRDRACLAMWSGGVKASDDVCYSMVPPDYDPLLLYCYANMATSVIVPCNERNKMCGTVFCNRIKESEMHMNIIPFLTLHNNFNNSVTCTSAFYPYQDGVRNPGIAPDGSKCGSNKMCLKRECVDVPVIVLTKQQGMRKFYSSFSKTRNDLGIRKMIVSFTLTSYIILIPGTRKLVDVVYKDAAGKEVDYELLLDFSFLNIDLVENGKAIYQLNLHVNTQLFTKGFTEYVVEEDGIRKPLPNTGRFDCNYKGHVDNDRSRVAFVNLCNGIKFGKNHFSGFFSGNESAYEISSGGLSLSLKYNSAYISNENRSRINVLDRKVRVAKIYFVIDFNEFYQMLDVLVAIVGIEYWNQNTLELRENATANDFTEFWCSYTYKHIYPFVIQHDITFLVTKHVFSKTMGAAKMYGMCFPRSSGGWLTTMQSAYEIGITFTHELGHTFGMKHNEDVPGCQCTGHCVMDTKATKGFKNYEWSSCSKEKIKYVISLQTCLFMPVEFINDAKCGNGILDINEECDCGNLPESVCNWKCCVRETCKLSAGSNCATGLCCDLISCILKKQDIVCRNLYDEECDIEDKCDGSSNLCPDQKFDDGKVCQSNFYCYKGICRTYDRSCQFLWGTKLTKGASLKCYDTNSLEGPNQTQNNCKFDIVKNQPIPCKKQNAMCGTLFCDGPDDKNSMRFGIATIFSSQLPDQSKCVSTFMIYSPYVDNPSYVEDGTKCGNGMICYESQCINLKNVPKSKPKRTPRPLPNVEKSDEKSETPEDYEDSKNRDHKNSAFLNFNKQPLLIYFNICFNVMFD
ncbi:hypothetical protein HELRODRAFT_187950 [Helobdella robusta]|uniref:Peptidase M12B domain-containing protein n=1 Tax=Helobdella robusta TaxID=6412 RepID=T1FPI0_HELRO|nr:hypothetical protein HELRODRAFT_187950 [Helobdella robusta]ESO12674.1 hypothetical protein HELRODRAFT_187950 [Helobdella robusta]